MNEMKRMNGRILDNIWHALVGSIMFEGGFAMDKLCRREDMVGCTAKTKCRKFETNIPRKGILGPQSQFPHSCVCERII
jgi:hypothetical protein